MSAGSAPNTVTEDDLEEDMVITMLATEATSIGGLDDVASTIMKVNVGETAKETTKKIEQYYSPCPGQDIRLPEEPEGGR